MTLSTAGPWREGTSSAPFSFPDLVQKWRPVMSQGDLQHSAGAKRLVLDKSTL